MKYFVGILAGAGIVGFIIFSINRPQTVSVATPLPPSPVSQSATLITISERGFEPSILSVPVGTTITFKNTGIEDHWPASDIHPSHEIYPEFDPKRSLRPGQEWSFTFTKAGAWNMHDHDSPAFEGTITVVDGTAQPQPSKTVPAAKPATTSLKDCEAAFDFSCYEREYQKIVAGKGVAAAFTELKKQYETNAYVRSQCHPLTHVIGRAATKLYGSVSEAYTKGDAYCWSGYYHGVMEGVIGSIGKSNVASKMSTICADIPGKEAYSFDYYNCVHGLGHGLMAMTNNELFDSLKLCDNLTGGWEQSSCYGGVFMENVIVDNKNHFTKYLKPDEPMYPCTAVDGPYKSACYLMQTSYAMKVTGNNFSKVFDLCRTKADEAYKTTCFQSLGRDASGQSISTIGPTKAACDLGADYNERSNCIIGAVKDFVSFYHSDVQAKEFCNALSADLTQICHDTVTAYYVVF